jgi:hypothetical protein
MIIEMVDSQRELEELEASDVKAKLAAFGKESAEAVTKETYGGCRDGNKADQPFKY